MKLFVASQRNFRPNRIHSISTNVFLCVRLSVNECCEQQRQRKLWEKWSFHKCVDRTMQKWNDAKFLSHLFLTLMRWLRMSSTKSKPRKRRGKKWEKKIMWSLSAHLRTCAIKFRVNVKATCWHVLSRNLCAMTLAFPMRIHCNSSSLLFRQQIRRPKRLRRCSRWPSLYLSLSLSLSLVPLRMHKFRFCAITNHMNKFIEIVVKCTKWAWNEINGRLSCVRRCHKKCNPI